MAIDNATLDYRDEAIGTQFAIAQWKPTTGRIADRTPTTLDLAATVTGVKPKAALRVGLKGGMAVDRQARTLAFTGLWASVAGAAPADKKRPTVNDLFKVLLK